MRYAIFAASSRGCTLACQLRDSLQVPAEVMAPVRCAAGHSGVKACPSMAEAVQQVFQGYDALIFVMAAGIAVRMLAPCLQSKLTDPAVLVMDEQGKHVISLLSGHIGGANALTIQIAELLQAEPVITTATDVNGMMAPDVLAAELSLRPYPKEHIKSLNRGLLEGRRIAYFIDEALPRASFYQHELEKRGIQAKSGTPASTEQGPCVWITAEETEAVQPERLLLRPRRLIAGIGCRRGIPKEKLAEALQSACMKLGLSSADISLLASTTVKQSEQGLLKLAADLGKELRFFSEQELKRKIQEYALEESAFVKQQIGAGNVCEAAALCCVKHGRIALPKTKFEKVTVALIWER